MILNWVCLCVRCVAVASILTLFLLICVTSTQAQASNVGAILQGTVSDSSGAVVPGATLTVTNTLTNQTRSVTSDGQGFFRASQLPVGTYEVQLVHPGFAPYRRTDITLSLGQTVGLSIILFPESAEQQVTVTAPLTGLDTSQTSVVSSIDQERIEELPVHSRNYLDFVLLAPGVSNAPRAGTGGGSTPLAGSGFTFGGLRPQSNNVLIDGLDNNDEFTGSSRTELSPEIVQEFQVVNNGLSAESGGASGGSINVITRSGANVVHGDAFIFSQDSAFNAREPFETQPQKPSFRRFRAGFALGAPIIKNKTFYYAAVEQEHNRGQIGSDIDPSVASAINPFLATGVLPGLSTWEITTGFRPFDPLVGLDSNRNGAFPLSSRPLGLGRNALQTPAVITLDLRVLKYFPFGGLRRLDLVAESFNVLNRANVAQANQVFGSALTPIAGFAQPTESLAARQIQFSIDFESNLGRQLTKTGGTRFRRR